MAIRLKKPSNKGKSIKESKKEIIIVLIVMIVVAITVTLLNK